MLPMAEGQPILFTNVSNSPSSSSVKPSPKQKAEQDSHDAIALGKCCSAY